MEYVLWPVRARIVAEPHGNHGFKVGGGITTAPKIRCKTAEDILRLDDGRSSAEVHGTVLTIGAALE
jgi:hypothetical protein